MTFPTVIAGIGAVAGLAAAGLWLYASLIEVPDNLNKFIKELQRIGRWNAYAAFAASIAALCGAILFGLQL